MPARLHTVSSEHGCARGRGASIRDRAILRNYTREGFAKRALLRKAHLAGSARLSDACNFVLVDFARRDIAWCALSSGRESWA